MDALRTQWPMARAWALRNWPIPVLLSILWIGRYLHSAEFGLYEDDLTHVPSAVRMTWAELGTFASGVLLRFGGSGHPIHLILLNVLSNLGWRLGELKGLYVLGYVIIGLNTVLFFKLVQRLGGTALAGLAGIAYVVYAADTTQAFLTHSFGVQTAIAMVLAAFHAYLRGHGALTYGLSALAILTYETTFLVLLAAPLLVYERGTKWSGMALRHAAAMAAIVLADLGLRFAFGEQRVSNLDLREIASLPILHMIQGPPVALGTYLYRPIQALSNWDVEKASIVTLCSIVVLSAFAVYSRGSASRNPEKRTLDAPADRQAGLEASWPDLSKLPNEIQRLAKLAFAGLAMLVLAYPLTFTVRAYAISGRDTRVHAAGVIGAALLVGSIMMAALHLGRTRTWRVLVAIVLAVWTGMMVGFGLDIQRDYVLAWDLQREFWTQLVDMIPDVGNGTVVLVDPDVLRDTRQIGANYWNLPRVLMQLYAFPEEWVSPPRVYRMAPGWRDRILTDQAKFRLDEATSVSPPATYGEFDPGNAILIVEGPDGLMRLTEFPTGRTGIIQLKAWEVSGEPLYPPALLHTLLVAENGTESGGTQDD